MSTINPGLERAICIAGSCAALADLLKITPMAVSHWKVRGVPAAKVISIEIATGVPRSALRPDLYPDAPLIMDKNIRKPRRYQKPEEPAVNSSSTQLVSS